MNIPAQRPKAIILAAGLGTRLKPWTDLHPKALAVVNGKSLLQRNVEYLQQFGIKDIVINVHHFAKQIITAVDENNGWGSNVNISYETDEPLETGGGLIHAAPLLQDSNCIVMMNVDILTNLNLDVMLQYHRDRQPLATLATTDRNTSRYFLFNGDNKLCGWRNTISGEERFSLPLSGDENQKAFSGINIIDHCIFEIVKHTGKFSIVDTYLELMKSNSILSFDHSSGKFIDVGKPESILQAEEMFE